MLDADDMYKINKLVDELEDATNCHKKMVEILRDLLAIRPSDPVAHAPSPDLGHRAGGADPSAHISPHSLSRAGGGSRYTPKSGEKP